MHKFESKKVGLNQRNFFLGVSTDSNLNQIFGEVYREKNSLKNFIQLSSKVGKHGEIGKYKILSYVLIFYRNFETILEFMAPKRTPICGETLAFLFTFFECTIDNF